MVAYDREGRFTYRHEAVMYGITAIAIIYNGVNYISDLYVYNEKELQILDSEKV